MMRFPDLHLAFRYLFSLTLIFAWLAGADVLAQSSDEALLNAAKTGDLAALRSTLANGASIETKNETGITALALAAHNGHYAVAQVLLEKGAKVDVMSAKERLTPLHLAALRGHSEVVQLLIRNQASLDSRDSDGETPLICAAARGYTEIVRVLIQAKANLELQNQKGETALSMALENKQTNAVDVLLLNRAPGKDGHPALIMAANSGRTEVVKSLLDRGEKPDTSDKQGHTALMSAANVEIARLLIAKGANINAVCAHGTTVLQMAVRERNLKNVKLLLESGARANVKDKEGETLLMNAASAGEIGILEEVLKLNFPVDERNEHNQTALMYAAESDKPSAVKLLLERGAKINAKAANGWTALHYAAYNGAAGAVEVLISKGVDINARDADGLTPLMIAASVGKDRKELRLSFNENIHLRYKAIVFLFLKAGVDVHVKDADGHTAIDFAFEDALSSLGTSNKKSIGDMLEEKGARRKNGSKKLTDEEWEKLINENQPKN